MRYRRYYTTRHPDGSRTVISAGPLTDPDSPLFSLWACPLLFFFAWIGFSIPPLFIYAMIFPHGSVKDPGISGMLLLSLLVTIVWWVKKVTPARHPERKSTAPPAPKPQVRARPRPTSPPILWRAVQVPLVVGILALQCRHRARLTPAARARYDERLNRKRAAFGRRMERRGYTGLGRSAPPGMVPASGQAQVKMKMVPANRGVPKAAPVKASVVGQTQSGFRVVDRRAAANVVEANRG